MGPHRAPGGEGELTPAWAAAALAAALALAATPSAAVHAHGVQFHMVTEYGNSFVVAPPDLPRPPNIFGEAAHLAASNPPAGMFALTSGDGLRHRFAPMQSGMDAAGFGGGTVRVIYGADWDAARDAAFGDQPFGTVSGDPLRHASAMPLRPGLPPQYEVLAPTNASRFGMDPPQLAVHAGRHGGHTVEMGGGRERVGLNFGPGTGADHTYYIYRGCSDCDALAAVGYGDRAGAASRLPGPADHPRGSPDAVRSCGASQTASWDGGGAGSVRAEAHIPPPAYSNAGGHHTDDRYANLTLAPTSRDRTPPCAGVQYAHEGRDNRLHYMCVTGADGTAATAYEYPSVTVTRTERYTGSPPRFVSGTTDTAAGTHVLHSAGSCGAPTVGSVGGPPAGYRVEASCTGGADPGPPADPPPLTTRTDDGAHMVVTRVTTTYGAAAGSTTIARVAADCRMDSFRPYVDLEGAMTLRPGLNVYRPPPVPASGDVLVVYDDAAGPDGGSESIQVVRHPGLAAHPAGPYDFHLKGLPSGVLYDSHAHYGWVDGRLYSEADLASMGYAPHRAMVGHPDGREGAGGGAPGPGSWLCHGDCLFGRGGIDGDAPRVRMAAPAASHVLDARASGLVYDHVNGAWFGAPGGADGRVVAASLYMVVPFAEGATHGAVWWYGAGGFDPGALNPSPRADPSGTHPCHTAQSGTRLLPSGAVPAGGSLMAPVLPGMRYAAFVANGDCHWYDAASLPSPLSGVSAGARHVPLRNGTVLAGDLAVRMDGAVHVDVVMDASAVYQSDAHGRTLHPAPPAGAAWVAPPLHVNLTAVARVNGASGGCGERGVHCSDAVELLGAAAAYGAYVHGPGFPHGAPYAVAPSPLPAGTAGTGMYGLDMGRCYGLLSVEASTGGITVRDISGVRVRAGDTVSLQIDAAVHAPWTAAGGATVSGPPGRACGVDHTGWSAVLDVRTMTATLR